jgi:lipid-A-disaccharide synthase
LATEVEAIEMPAPVLYIICGEASGDLHGANLIQAIRKRNPEVQFFGTGGDRMQAAGMKLNTHIREMNFMGFVEVISNLPKILGIMRSIKSEILARKPNAVLLVDYPGMNLKLAPWIRAQGIPVLYYISPQLWAWKKDRVEIIRKYVNRMFVVLPFEEDFYREEGILAEFYGHPLLDEFENPVEELPELKAINKPIIALLPGSRAQEIRKILPEFLKAVHRFPGYEPVIACAPAIADSLYDSIPEAKGVKRVKSKTRELLRNSQMALVASGTATLETALAGVPQVVGYKANALSVFLARQLVTVNYISLVNLILNKPAILELIQDDLTEDNLVKELNALLSDSKRRQEMQKDYLELRKLLGGAGCSDRIATQILEVIE